MAAKLTIRYARAEDAADLTALARRAKASHGYPAEWLAAWDEELTVTADYLLGHTVFVADNDDVTVGMCALDIGEDRVALEHVWVSPDAQGRGVGRQLVTRALDAARDSGATVVKVVSDPFAEPFYLKLGARRCGEVPAPMPGAPTRTLPVLELDLDLR